MPQTLSLSPRTTTPPGSSIRAGVAAQTALAAVLWGAVGPMVALYPHDAAAGFAIVRLGVGACLLALLARQAPRLRRFGRPDLLTLVFGGLSVATFQPLYFEAVHRAGVALATFVAIGLAPVVTGLSVWVLRGRRPSRRWWAAAATAGAGVALLGSQATELSGGAGLLLTGVALAALACAAYSLQALTISRLACRHGEARAVSAIFVAGALMLTPTAAFAKWSWATEPSLMLGSVLAGVATLALAYRLFAAGVRRLGAPTAVLITLLEPVAAATFAVLLVGQQMTLLEAGAAALVLFGIGAAVLDQTRPILRADSAPSRTRQRCCTLPCGGTCAGGCGGRSRRGCRIKPWPGPFDEP